MFGAFHSLLPRGSGLRDGGRREGGLRGCGGGGGEEDLSGQN